LDVASADIKCESADEFFEIISQTHRRIAQAHDVALHNLPYAMSGGGLAHWRRPVKNSAQAHLR
jgi:hypothetical protein